VPTVVIPPLAITLITSTPRCSRLRDASRDQVGVPLLDVVVQCLPHLLLEVELVAWDRLRSLPGWRGPSRTIHPQRRCSSVRRLAAASYSLTSWSRLLVMARQGSQTKPMREDPAKGRTGTVHDRRSPTAGSSPSTRRAARPPVAPQARCFAELPPRGRLGQLSPAAADPASCHLPT